MEQEKTFAPSQRATVGVWVAWLCPPIAWLSEMTSVYALTPLACSTGLPLILHVPFVVFLALSVISGWLAWHIWRGAGSGWPEEHDMSKAGITRFLAVLALMSSGLFTLVIIAQWISIIGYDPCQGLRL